MGRRRLAGVFDFRCDRAGRLQSGIVVGHALSHDRAGARRTRDHGDRRSVAAVHVLYGLHRRRRLEDHRCRAYLGERLRRVLRGRLDGRGRSLAVRSRTSSTRARDRRRSAATCRSGAASTSPPTPARRGPSPACATSARSPPCAIHPTNPEHRVRGGARAIRSSPNKERGVYRSTDGGKTWKKVLFVSDTCGRGRSRAAARQSRTWSSPAMWHGQRKPWTIISGAHEGGIYKSTDGGDTGPSSPAACRNELFGRSNVAISAANPNRIYALIEAKPGSGLYRSEDAGATWTLVNGSAQSDHAAVLLRHARRRSEQRRRRLGRRRRLVQEHGRRQELSHVAGAAWRQPRRVDQSEELAVHDPVERRRRERVARRRPHLEHADRTSRRPRSTRWRSTISIPIASTARSRTTPR